MRIRSDNLEPMQPITEEFAFGKPGPNGEPMVFAPNRNPHLAWSDIPQWTRSFVLACIDTECRRAAMTSTRKDATCRHRCRARNSSTG